MRIIKETDKAILVDNCRRFWIAKARIVKIRLKDGVFEIYIWRDIVR